MNGIRAASVRYQIFNSLKKRTDYYAGETHPKRKFQWIWRTRTYFQWTSYYTESLLWWGPGIKRYALTIGQDELSFNMTGWWVPKWEETIYKQHEDPVRMTFEDINEDFWIRQLKLLPF